MQEKQELEIPHTKEMGPDEGKSTQRKRKVRNQKKYMTNSWNSLKILNSLKSMRMNEIAKKQRAARETEKMLQMDF